MADILIRGISEATEGRLQRQATDRGLSLDAYLIQVLEGLATEDELSEETEPFGSWLVRISRPGVDLTRSLSLLRGDHS
jgi:hypothetical protein